MAVGVALIAAGVTVGLWLSAGGAVRPQGLRSLFGRVVADTRTGAAVAYTPSSGGLSPYGPAGTAPFTPVALSPDGRTWLASTGTIFTIGQSGKVTRSGSVASAFTSITTPALPFPFTGGDKGVVVLSHYTDGSPSDAMVVSVAGGRGYDLGVVDGAAGDPQTSGAFVSVPSDPRLFRMAHATVGDTEVELRVPGRLPAVLATSSQLDADVGWSTTRPVQLAVYPSPTGDAIAVVLTALDQLQGDTPMVVMTRDGGLLAAVDDWSGPMYGSRPVWSPGAHQLAFPTYTTAGPALAIGSETGAFGTVPAPVGTRFGSCVWSLSSTDVVCQARTGGRYQWLYAVPSSNRLLSTSSAGAPVAWVAGPVP